MIKTWGNFGNQKVKNKRKMNEKKKNSQLENTQRRNFLKYSLMAGGGLLVGKVLDSIINLEPKSSETYESSESKVTSFKSFTVKEDERELSFFDRGGHKIFVIEKSEN